MTKHVLDIICVSTIDCIHFITIFVDNSKLFCVTAEPCYSESPQGGAVVFKRQMRRTLLDGWLPVFFSVLFVKEASRVTFFICSAINGTEMYIRKVILR